MASLTITAPHLLHRHACSLCARRKVKCDKGEPCSNCLKIQAQCLYEPFTLNRPRKRAADDDLLARLALYEDLMRKHNVDFTHCGSIWVPSGLEDKLKESNSTSPASMAPTTSHPNSKPSETRPSENNAGNAERCLWLNLSSELKYPPIQSLRHKDDPFLHPTPPLQSLIFFSTRPKLYELHPEPRHIYRLWQTFVESVNPLIKIVHVPTLQQRILDASWDPANVSKSLGAILFAVYTLAVTSMSSDDCKTTFGDTRATLLTRYRAATLRALIAADFLTTRELEVLQAFVLFLLADPESELTFTLTAVVIRLGQKLGLHRDNNDPKISFFEKEMRIRLWWQLRGFDSRVRNVSTPGMKPPPSEFGEIRPPLNVNDADLHPDMIDPPVEHSSPTEMLCVLMKYEVSNWLRSSQKAAKVFESIIQGPMRAKLSREAQDEVIDELEAIYNEKYISNLDRSIPLHGVCQAMASLLIARLRFMAHHPRRRAAINGGELYMTQKECDMLFDLAVISLEMVDVGIRSKFSSHLFTHLTSKFQVDAYIYVISELRRRHSGDRVALAWKLVEHLYTEHPELIIDKENIFVTALGDLTLEAWEARRGELVRDRNIREYDITPHFIQLLWSKRQSGNKGKIPPSNIMDPRGLDSLGLMDENDLDSDHWDDFLWL